MAIIVQTPKPTALLSSIKKAIDNKEIETWSYDKGGDFIHSPPQWSGKAWLKPIIASASLVFGLLGQKDVVMKKTIYGVYHGRFVEMLLTHFDDAFTSASTTAHAKESANNYKAGS